MKLFSCLDGCLLGLFGLLVVINRTQAQERTYTFAFTDDGFPFSYLDRGAVVGQSVEMILQVCKFAGKNCQVAMVQREQCWDNVHGFPPYSKVLNDRWYDACANLPPSRYRRLGYALPNETFFYLPPPSLIVHKDSELELKDIAAPCNDLTIAYPKNTGLTEECLRDNHFFIQNTVGVQDNNLMEVTRSQIKMVANRSVRKDNTELLNWWSEALSGFMCSGNGYIDFCSHLSKKYGSHAPCREPGYDVDCSKFGGPRRMTRVKDCDKERQPCTSEPKIPKPWELKVGAECVRGNI